MRPLHIIALAVSLIALAVSAATFRCPSCNAELTVAPTTTPPPEPPPQTNVTGRLDLDRFSWSPGQGGGTLALPLGIAAEKIGLSKGFGANDGLGRLTQNASRVYKVSAPSVARLYVQMHGADVLEFSFNPSARQTLSSARCVYYTVSGGAPPAGWTWRQKGATKWERVP